MSLRLVLPVLAVGGAFLVGRALAPEAKPPPRPLVVVSEDAGAAAARARAIVDGALRVGRWTRGDASALLAEIPRLDRQVAAEILSRLDAAVNARAVTVETSGTLLEHVRRTP